MVDPIGAGTDKPAVCNVSETPKRSGYIGFDTLPDCCLSQPRPFRGFAFPAAVRVADTYVRARGEGKHPVPASGQAAFSFLAFVLSGIDPIAFLRNKGGKGGFVLRVPFSFGGYA